MRVPWAEVGRSPWHPARVPAPVWWHQGRGSAHAVPTERAPGRQEKPPLSAGVGKVLQLWEVLMPGLGDSGSRVLTGTFDLGAVPGLVAPGTAPLGCRMVLSPPCLRPWWLLGTPFLLPQLLPAPASRLWVLDWDFWDISGIFGDLAGVLGQCGSREWKGPDISSRCGVTRPIPWSIPWIRRCLMGLEGSCTAG